MSSWRSLNRPRQYDLIENIRRHRHRLIIQRNLVGHLLRLLRRLRLNFLLENVNRCHGARYCPMNV